MKEIITAEIAWWYFRCLDVYTATVDEGLAVGTRHVLDGEIVHAYQGDGPSETLAVSSKCCILYNDEHGLIYW